MLVVTSCLKWFLTLCFLHVCVCSLAKVSNEDVHMSQLWTGLFEAVCFMLALLSALLCVVIMLRVSSAVSCVIDLNIVSVYACLMLYFGICFTELSVCPETSVKS